MESIALEKALRGRSFSSENPNSEGKASKEKRSFGLHRVMSSQFHSKSSSNESLSTEQELEMLREAYRNLMVKHDALVIEHAALLNQVGGNSGVLALSAWKQYIKLAFLASVTAFLLFVTAEKQALAPGRKALFGALSSIGAAALFLSIPATHWIGSSILQGYEIWQPFKGGARFVVLQAISWTFYGMTAIIVASAIVFAEEYAETSDLLASAGVVGVLSQVFMISSLLTYSPNGEDSASAPGNIFDEDFLREEEESFAVPTKLKRTQSATAKSVIDAFEDESSQLLSVDQIDVSGVKRSVVREFLVMNTGLLVIGIALAALAELYPGRSSPLFGILSLFCCIAAVFLSYGIGGRLRHEKDGWDFLQMFRGGKEFVAMQIVGWMLFGLAIVIQGVTIMGSIRLRTHGISGGMYISAALAAGAHFTIVQSLPKFEGVLEKESEITPSNYRGLPKFGILDGILAWTVLAFFCNLQYVSFLVYILLFCAPYVIPFGLRPTVSMLTFQLVPVLEGTEEEMQETLHLWFAMICAVACWTFFFSAVRAQGVKGWRQSLLLSLASVAAFGGVMAYFRDSAHHRMLFLVCVGNLVYVSTTFTKRPETNACREWPLLKNFQLFPDIGTKFFALEIVLTDEMKKISPKLGLKNPKDTSLQQVMLFFHPHGIFPLTHSWMHMTSQWRKYFPNLHVHPLTATVIHIVPVMRDLIQWTGSCDVSRETVTNLLRMGRSIQVVVGGQLEMFESRSWDTEIFVVRKRRRGIFKIAIQHNLGIVPIFSFGENQIFDNIYAPQTQTFSKNLLGFPFPFFMLGKFGLPIPRRTPLTLVVGAPVFPKAQNASPSLEEVEELQMRYFDTLEVLFEEHKDKYGHAGHKIKWIDN